MKTFNVSDAVYGFLVKRLTNRIKTYYETNQKLTHLIAVARGGLIPAQYVAYQLGIQQVYSIGVYSYKGTQRQKIQPYQSLPIFDMERPRFLIIDNLVDSGHTLSFIVNHLEDVYPNCECITAVLFKKEKSDFNPTIFAQETPQDVWIQFPYEPKEKI